MRLTKFSLALSLLLVAGLAVACSDRPSPTAPSIVVKASAAVGTCTTIGDLEGLVTYVFGPGSPSVSSGLAKLKQVERDLGRGNIPAAQESARNLIRFLREKADGLVGRDRLQLLIDSIECYVGITDDSFLIYPSDQPQTLVTGSGKSGLQFDGNPVSEPTLITITELPDNTVGLLDTKLDKYPGFIVVTQQSGVTNSLVKPVVVGVCPTGGIPTAVLDRLRLGHQRTVSGFEITPAADASYLDCSSVVGATGSGSALPGWVQSLANLVLPKPLYAAVSAMAFAGGGVGGTVTEFSPFGPVDPELSFGGGVGGTVTEFIRMPVGGDATTTTATPQRKAPERRAPERNSATATLVGAGSQASLAHAEECLEGIVGTEVLAECRPRVTVTTANGTIMIGVPITFTIGSGGGTTAIDDPTARTCGTFGAAASTLTNANGRAGACWTLGATEGVNTLVASATPGGDVPAGAYFEPSNPTFTVTARKATATITLSDLNQTFTGAPLAITAATSPAGLLTVNVTYDGSPSAPTNAGTYAVVATLDNPSWQGSASGSLVIAQSSQAALIATGPGSLTYDAPAVQLGTTGGNGTGSVTYSAGASTACSVTSGGSLSMTSGTGSCAVTATKAGDSNYSAISSDPIEITPVKAAATITLGNLGPHTYDGTPKSATATTSPSGLTVLTVTGSGTIVGSYPAGASLDNDNYAAAPASSSLVINKANQSALSLTTSPGVTFGNTGTSSTSGGSGSGAVTFSASGGGCSVDAGTGVITVVNASLPCSISASKAGDSNYNGPTTAGPNSVTLTKAPATITLSNLGPHTYDGTLKSATATVAPVVTGLSVTGSGTNAGSYLASASLVNDNYAAAPASNSLVIAKLGATATSGSATIDFGAAVPAIPCTVTGLLSGDAGSVSCTTSVPAVNAAGSFTTTPVISPANPVNYAMASATGTLTVRGYIQTGCFSSPIFNVMPETKSAQRKGSNLPVKCTLASASGVPLTFPQGNLIVQDRGSDPNIAPNIAGTVVFSGANVFTASNSGNYSYGLNTGGAGFISGNYYYVTATWLDGSKSQGWFLLR